MKISRKVSMVCILAIALSVMLGVNNAQSGILGDGFTLTINGIDVDRFSKTVKEDPLQAIGGAVVAMIVHEVSHVVAMEVAGVKEYRFEAPLTFRYNSTGISDGDKRWISRAGFFGQAVVGTLLTQIPATRETPFTFGYTAGAALQTISYPLPPNNGNANDLGELDRYGANAMVEWGTFSAWSLFNLYHSVRKSDAQESP